jgi:predicted RNase H-like HicB family nuclease
VTEGDAEDEAVRMADDAIQAVLDYRRDHGLPIPDDAAPTPREVRIAVAE